MNITVTPVASDAAICSFQIQRPTDKTLIPGWWTNGAVKWTCNDPTVKLIPTAPTNLECRVEAPPHAEPLTVTVRVETAYAWPEHREYIPAVAEVPIQFTRLTPLGDLVIVVRAA